MANTRAFLDAAKLALSAARLSTYEAAAHSRDANDPAAISLYAWNAMVSAAFMAPIHICEVVVRNAVSDALEAVYGPLWPWDGSFQRSLPSPKKRYSPSIDLQKVAAQQPTTGKVIPELKFAFWQEMFTTRHDVRLWQPHLKRVFPLHDPTRNFVALRREIYSDLNVIRELRNRIAHHEPILNRNLAEDFERLVELVQLRSSLVASWMVCNQDAQSLLSTPPIFKGGKLWAPSHEEISALAYRIWCDGGKASNTAQRDWATAESILKKP